jgi:enoyl-CoA hydratase
VKAGITAGDGGALMWALNAGFPAARYHLLTGEPMPAERALQIGLINEVLPRDEVLIRATAIARQLADGPGQAIRGTKRIFAKVAELLGAGVFEFAAELERVSLYSEDHKEAIQAHFEEREPVFNHR